jgi:hypothetical protein
MKSGTHARSILVLDLLTIQSMMAELVVKNGM